MKQLRYTVTLALILGVIPYGHNKVSASPVPRVVTTSDRASVIESYNAEFNRVEPPSEWSGDINACRSGGTSSAYQLSVLQRVNWYRAMAGLPDVSYNATLVQRAQDAALIGSANGALSHTPASTAKCYTASGRTGTENSNLGLGVVGVRAVDGYIQDPGENNAAVGHRAWLLSRSLGGIATGDVESDGEHYSANAIYVNGGGGTTTTPRDGYIAWPPSGFVPDAVLYDRWSFSTGGAGVSYQNANVTVTGANGALPVQIENRSGFLEAGIVFAPTLPSRNVTSDTTYTVTITGITGGATSSYSYQVTVIPVNEPAREKSTSSWGAPTCAAPLSNIAQVNLSDPEGDSSSYRLVAGYGDIDNALFQVTSDGVIQNTQELDTTKTRYYLRYESSDALGWKTQNNLAVTLKDPAADTSVVCPGRNLTLTPNSRGGVRVSWDNPVVGGAGTWYVFFSPGGAFCAVATPGCDVTTLQNGTTYKVDLYNVRGTWSVPYTMSYTKTAEPTTTPVTTVPPTKTMKTLKRGKTAKLSTYGVVPSGTKTYKTTGPCSVNRSTAKVTASRTRVGVCTVTTTVKTRSRTGALVVKKSQIRLKVV